MYSEVALTGFNTTLPSLEGKACLHGCTHVYGAQAGEGQVYTHVTSASSGDRSDEESVQRGIAGFFRPAASRLSTMT